MISFSQKIHSPILSPLQGYQRKCWIFVSQRIGARSNPQSSETNNSRKTIIATNNQVAELMVPILQREGKMMALTDVYCVLNRRRGTALISPEDLYKASLLLASLNLPIHLRQFQSGMLVLKTTTQFMCLPPQICFQGS